MSARHPISFSHSLAVVRNTRRSATASHCGGYGCAGDVEEEGGGRAISRVLFALPKVGRWSSLWDGCRQPPRRGLPAAQTTRAGSRCLFGLAPTGGCRAVPVARPAVGSYPTVSPLPFGYKGGLFSVALFRRLTAPRRYLAVCPVELGLSSNGPFSRPPATIGPTTSSRRTYRAAPLPGKPLLRQPPDHATQTVGCGAIEPETRVLAEGGVSQPRQLRRRQRLVRGVEFHRRERRDATILIAAQQRARVAGRDLAQPQQHRRIRTRQSAQQPKRE